MDNLIIFPLGENGELHVHRDVVISRLLDSLTPSSAVPKIGEPWHGQGGINAGLMRGMNGNSDYWLILPTEAAADFGALEWGTSGEKEDGAQSEYDGLANTRSLVESAHSHPAAEACTNLQLGVHNDYYLPARRELSLLYANVPELFEKCWHWSSTQGSSYDAWIQNFNDGFQGYGHKYYKARVRAVRRVSHLAL